MQVWSLTCRIPPSTRTLQHECGLCESLALLRRTHTTTHVCVLCLCDRSRKQLGVVEAARLESLWTSLVQTFFDVFLSLDAIPSRPPSASRPSSPVDDPADQSGGCGEFVSPLLRERCVRAKERVIFANDAFYVFFRLYAVCAISNHSFSGLTVWWCVLLALCRSCMRGF